VSGSRGVTLPNIITVARIVACPVIFFLAIAPGMGARLWAFILFVAAGLSDVWDGWYARRYDLITDTGKLLDPIADKLLLVATFVPFYIVSHSGREVDLVPFLFWFVEMPLWVIIVIFGRELFITGFRGYAARRGVVIPAGKSGKRKTLFQLLFVGGLMLWYPLRMRAEAQGWSGGFWTFWTQLHSAWVGIMLILAIVLTIYSMLDYLWSYRAVVGIRS
jgi:CDP-diacylglycerol--glycerol-3-phosphate 3-phosphatidyltransferase